MLDFLRKWLVSELAPSMADDGHAFDREKVLFEQNIQHFRHLNEQMNKVPPFAVTLTGGFWYVAFIQHLSPTLSPHLEATARFLLMIFAAIANFMLVLIAIRIRDVMRGYQRKFEAFSGQDSQSKKEEIGAFRFRNYSMISMYSAMMLTASAVSLIAAFMIFWPQMGLPLCYGVFGVPGAFIVVVLLSIGLPKWLER
jgi:hypothetical protein